MSKRQFRIYTTFWQLLTTFLIIILPFLFLLFFSSFANIASGKLFKNVGVSFIRLLIAYGIAASMGWGLAVMFYRGKRGKIALPIFDVLQSFPTFALLPLITYLWGTSTVTVVIFLVVTIIWPIIFSIVSSLKLIKQDWVEVVHTAKLKGLLYLKKFLWPASIPGLITGSIIGLGEGWEALVATEIITGTKQGLGNFFQQYARDPQITFLGILGFLILIFSINKMVWLPLLEWSHRRMED